MSSASIELIHRDRLPAGKALVIPGRLDFAQLLGIEKLLLGRKITWLIEEDSKLDPQTKTHLERSGSGAMFSASDGDPAAVGAQLAADLDPDGLLVYVPGLVTARNASTCHVPSRHLKALCALGLTVIPLEVDIPRESALSIEKPSSLPAGVLVVGNPIPAGKATVAAYYQSLLEAAELSFSDRSFLNGSLATALLEGLKKHGSKHRVIDGADDAVGKAYHGHVGIDVTRFADGGVDGHAP
ncbi:MAG: hypothetical protein WCH40_06215, partial [Verrucomicrobiales bacterium]